MKKVVVGGSIRGLEEHHSLAKQVIEEMGMKPIMLEELPAGGEVLETIFEYVRQSDIYVGIMGVRYGWIPDDIRNPEGFSIDELQYEVAREKNIPCLMFWMSDKHPVSRGDIEQYEARYDRLQYFRQKVLSNYIVGFYDSAQDFKSKLLLALSRYQPKNEVLLKNAEIGGDLYINQLDEKSIQNVILRAIDLYDARRATDTTRVNEDDPDAITVKPVFSRVSRSPEFQSDVFVIMPFAKEYTEVFTKIILPIEEDLEITIKRGDDEGLASNHHIMDEIWYLLYNTKLVIADCTGKNPNVFYELGIAHTLGKPVLVITQDDKAPFDIASRRIIFYKNTVGGAEELKNTLIERIRLILNRME